VPLKKVIALFDGLTDILPPHDMLFIRMPSRIVYCSAEINVMSVIIDIIIIIDWCFTTRQQKI